MTIAKKPMTVMQRAALNYIIRYKYVHDGNSPTVREIMDATSYTSVSAVNHTLHALEKRGYITRPKGKGIKSRSIHVNGGRWVYAPQEEGA